MRRLLEDLRKSGPFRVGMGYALTGIALLVAGELVLGSLGAPPWVLRLMVAAVFMAFPFVVALTWALSAGPPDGRRAPPSPWEL